MSTFSMAFKNLKKNLSYYTLYLISVSLVIMIFFAFTSFSQNKVMLEEISSDGRVEMMCRTVSVFLMVFVVFYMSYSNRFFLRRRTKELGIYALLGYRKSTMLVLLTFENLMIGLGAFVVGLCLGAVMHKGIVMGITALLKLSIDVAIIPLFNGGAIVKTAGFIFLVNLVMIVSNGRFLYKVSLMELVRYEKKSEKKMQYHFLPALIGLVFILSGYGIALDILKGADSIWIIIGFIPVGMLTLMLIVIGTVFFISSFLPYVMQKSKNNKRAFYTHINIITTPNFIYRIRSNARTLIMLTLLSAGTLTISTTMALTLYYPIAAVSRMSPSEIEFRIDDNSQVDKVKVLVEKTVTDKDKVSFIQTDIYKVLTSSKTTPLEYKLGTAKGDGDNEDIVREVGFECISYSNYIALLKAQGKDKVVESMKTMKEDECIYVKYQPDRNGKTEVGETYPLLLGDETQSVTVKEITLANPISFANSIATMIVNDDVYKRMEKCDLPKTGIVSINGKELKGNEQLYGEIKEILNDSPYIQGYSHRVSELFSLNSSTFLLIGFLVVLFFIASGSILYFNNISAVYDTKEDYEILLKMGYTDRHIKRIMRKQVLTFFGIPFVAGLLDCIFATLVYKNALMQNLLGKSLMQYLPVVIAIVLVAVIYMIYYLLTVRTCQKAILSK